MTAETACAAAVFEQKYRRIPYRFLCVFFGDIFDYCFTYTSGRMMRTINAEKL
jgi:hypothetical protein